MAEETITILRVGTDEAVKNVADLKANIKDLKKQIEGYDEVVDGEIKHIDGLTIGSQEYQKTLKELQTNQVALKNAMYATTASMEDVTKAANGTGQSYNALVKQMADLKQELRAVDVSTEEGRETFKALANQIQATNDELKRMDAMQGNYQRNVGNYTESIKKALVPMKDIDKVGGAAALGFKKMNEAMKVMAANPLIFTLTALLKVADAIKKAFDRNTEATEELQSALTPLSNITKVVTKVMDTLAMALAKVVKKVSEFIQRIAPKMITKLQDWAGTEKETTEVVEEETEKRISARTKEVEKTKELLADLEKILTEYEARVERLRTQHEKDADEVTKLINEETALLAEDINALVGDMNDEFLAGIQAQIQAELDAEEQERQIMERRKDTLESFAYAVPSILNSISDADEKHESRNKILKIAAATIDTISGAVKAYMSSAANPIAGAAKAAAVTAAGMAQIAKIRAVPVGSSTSSSSGISVAAPSVQTYIPQTQSRSVTSSTEEERLNQMASDQRVYILSSDIEASQHQIKVQTSESSF